MVESRSSIPSSLHLWIIIEHIFLSSKSLKRNSCHNFTEYQSLLHSFIDFLKKQNLFKYTALIAIVQTNNFKNENIKVAGINKSQ